MIQHVFIVIKVAAYLQVLC